MKVVFDEGVPKSLARRLRSLGVEAAPMPHEWHGLSNGRLISAAGEAGFDVLLSNDKNIVHQHNLAALRIAIVTLPTNRRPTILPRSEDIADTLQRAQKGQLIVIGLDGRRIGYRVNSNGAVVVEEFHPVDPFEP